MTEIRNPNRFSLVFFFSLRFRPCVTPHPSPGDFDITFLLHPASSRIFHQSDWKELGIPAFYNPCSKPFESIIVRLSCHSSVLKKTQGPFYTSCDDFAIRFVKEKILDGGPFVVFASESSFNSHHPPPSKKHLAALVQLESS